MAQNTRQPEVLQELFEALENDPSVIAECLARPMLAKVSTRALVQIGDNVMIGGFIIQGTQPKRVILRAIGLELMQHGMPNVLPDPTLETA